MNASPADTRLSSIASRNAATAVGARVSAILVGLILTPFLLGKLEARLYGLVIAVGSIYDYLSLLRGGMGGAMRRYVTLHYHAGRRELASEYYRVGFWWAAILRCVVLVGGLALAWPITGFFRIEDALRPTAAVGIALIFLAAIVTDQAILFNIPIYATGRTAMISTVQTVQGWVRILVVMAALTWLGASLPAYGGGVIAVEILAMITYFVLAQRSGTVGAAIPRPRVGSPEVRRELFRYGGLALLSQTAALLYLSADNLLIGRFYGPEAVTHYSLGTRWTPLIMGFLLATMSGLTPIFTSLEARGEQDRSRSALLRVLDVTAALAFPLCLAPCLVGDLFLEQWVGAQYRDSWHYMIAMLGPTAIDGALTPIWMALNARGRIGWVATSDVLVAVANVGISLILALGMGLGLLGFALGNTIALVVRNTLLVLVVRRRDPTMPSLGAVLRPLPLGLLGAAPGLVLLWFLRPVVAGSLAGVVAAGMGCASIGLAGSLLATCGPRGILELWQMAPFNRARRRTAPPAPPASWRPEERDMISVIIPVYNGRDLIERAVRSVEAQTHPAGEIIVIDDHSTDGTKELLQEWEQAGRIRLLHRERGGPARARNDGLREARGRWVAFLDADDEFDPRALQACREAVDRRPETDWVMSDVVRVRPTREEIKVCSPPQSPDADWVAAILERNFVERGFFFRRETLLQFGGFHAVVTYFEDWDLFIRLIRADRRPVHVPETLYRYIETEGSITRDPDFMVRVLRRVLDRHHEPLARQGNPVYRRIYAHRLWGMGQDYYYKLRRPGRALLCLAESLRYDFNLRRVLHRLLARRTKTRRSP